ncbi:MAG TPA: alpha/beta hydrolase [Streptosporangiaceae bacterium]|nr:alpha/beta hydrolase [Streptosporangiaceae bacterium]
MTAPPRPAGWNGTSRAHGLRLPPALMRQGVRQIGRRVLDPALAWEVQRRRFDQVMHTSLMPRGTRVAAIMLDGVPAEMVTAATARPGRTVVHFHGGGYCLGSARMMRTWAARLSAQTGCRVVVPEYRLAPAHAYPAALDDAHAVLKALLGEADPASIVVSGDSAGGGLALSLILALRDSGAKAPAGCILMSPWLDLTIDRWARPALVRKDLLLNPPWLEACAAAYADPAQWPDPRVSPLRASHGGLPPLLIQAASDDLLAPDAELLATSASAANVDVTYTRWPNMWHDFALLPGLVSAADSALTQSAWFVETVTSG